VLEIGRRSGLTAFWRPGRARVGGDRRAAAAVAAIGQNALLNGVAVDARLGDGYAPVAGERFTLTADTRPDADAARA